MSKPLEPRSAAERATLRVMSQAGQSRRALARTLHRRPATLSRAWRRQVVAATPGSVTVDDAQRAGQEARRRRLQWRRVRPRAVEGILLGVVPHGLPAGGSPGQLAGTRKRRWPDAPDRTVSAETLYPGIYALPRGALRQAWIAG